MNANRMAPPIAVPSKNTWKNVGQSATPAVNCAFVPINPIARARSGSFKMYMKSPSTRGKIENPATDSRLILDRRALSVSAQNAEGKEFMVVLRSAAGNELRLLFAHFSTRAG